MEKNGFAAPDTRRRLKLHVEAWFWTMRVENRNYNVNVWNNKIIGRFNWSWREVVDPRFEGHRASGHNAAPAESMQEVLDRVEDEIRRAARDGTHQE